MNIRPAQASDVPKIKAFTDKAIGVDYYSTSELEKILQQSSLNGRQFTLLLEDEESKIRGVRITYPPGQWEKGKGKGLSPEKWNVPKESVAYFQSLFIDLSLTGKGWGQKVSMKSIEMLKETGAKAIATHSWKESPNDSSGRYLRGLGFELINTHPLYWKDVDYVCTRCGKPCLCTAEEMLKRL